MQEHVFSLEGLNPQQREAVTSLDGPTLIIAGAGTGKTKVITSKILHLMLNEQVAPESILALTFTEKAQMEMMERIDLAMPLSYEEMWVKTFHSFCDSILRQRGIDIGIDPSFKLMSRMTQWVFVKQHLFEFDLQYYRPLGNPAKFIHGFLQHFSRLRDEDISPEQYLEYAQNLPEDTIPEEREKLLELAHSFATYQRLKLENNCLDFGDLLFYVLRLFEKRPNVLKDFQRKFQYVLVDEFQDTNYSQTKLAFLLAQEHKNISVVADDDQSIYKWRGASLYNILEFEKYFPNSKKISLIQNYRCTQPILDAAYTLIQKNNPDRLEAREQIDKKLVSNQDGGEKPQIWHFAHYLDEVKYVVQYIRDHAQEGRYGEFCILIRANSHAEPFVDALKSAGIPYVVRSTEGLLSFPVIKDVLSLLKLLRNPYDDIAFYRYLHLPIFEVAEEEILDLLHKGYKTKDSLYETLKLEDTTMPFEGMESHLVRALRLLRELFTQSPKSSVRQLIYSFLQKSGYLEYFMHQNSQESVDALAHLNQFSTLVTDFESDNREPSLQNFLEYLDLLEESQTDESSSVLESKDGHAVQILTIHSSKGLEFPTVFIVNMVNQRFPSSPKKDPIPIPDLLSQEPVLPQHHIQEERRLLYVALTRAKQNVLMSYSDTYEGKKKWKPSVFLTEIHDVCELHDGETSAPFSEVTEKEPKHFITPALPKVVRLNKLSYSQMETFKTCPLKYQFRYLTRLPTPPSHAANFGSSVHDTLNNFYQYVQKGEQVNLDLMKELYAKHWIGTGYDSKAHENLRKQKGWDILKSFYEKNSHVTPQGFAVPAFLERNFNLKIGNVLFTGRIDRIDRLPDGTYEVIDYKTGTMKRDSKLDKDLQLSLYALACRDVFRIPVSSLCLYFLEDNLKVSTTRTDEQLESLKQDLRKVVGDMQTSDFQPTSGFHCQFCDYRLVCPAV